MVFNNMTLIRLKMSCNKVPNMMSLKELKRKNPRCSKRKSRDTKPRITENSESWKKIIRNVSKIRKNVRKISIKKLRC